MKKLFLIFLILCPKTFWIKAAEQEFNQELVKLKILLPTSCFLCCKRLQPSITLQVSKYIQLRDLEKTIFFDLKYHFSKKYNFLDRKKHYILFHTIDKTYDINDLESNFTLKFCDNYTELEAEIANF